MQPITHDLRPHGDVSALGVAVEKHMPLHVRYSAGEMVCQIDSYVAGVHIVHSGVVSDRAAGPDGTISRSCILGSGDLLGLEVLRTHGGTLAASQLRALTDTELHFLRTDEFRQMLADDAAFARAVMDRFASQYFRIQRAMLHAGSDKTALCHLLARLGSACGHVTEDGRASLPQEIDRATLCDLAGLSPRQLQRLKPAIPSLRIATSCITFDMHDVTCRLTASP
jgi:CRP-like cAMP-binding protein